MTIKKPVTVVIQNLIHAGAFGVWVYLLVTNWQQFLILTLIFASQNIVNSDRYGKE